MGIGIIIIFLLIIFMVIALILTPFMKNNGFVNSFLKIFTTILVFFIVFFIINNLSQEFIGKHSSAFGDNGYCEVKNGYMIEWIDTWDNAILTDGNKTIAINVKSFSESFKFFTDKDLIIIKKSTNPNKFLIVDTIKKAEDLKSKKWLVNHNILEKKFITPYEYLKKESTKLVSMLIELVISLLCTYLLYRNFYKKEEEK